MDDKELFILLENLKILVLPSKEQLTKILDAVVILLELEENLVYIEGDSYIVGDLHGQFFDFLNMLELTDLSKNLIFLGDYVDRGMNSVELMIYLVVMKLINAYKITLIRGNHENRTQTAVYGFQEECINKYDLYIYWKFCEVFEYFPVAVILNKTYFCVHGGIKPELALAWIKSKDRIKEFGELSALLWGDPSEEIEYFTESHRGAGYLYGEKAVNEFLVEIGCRYLVRSHQLVFQGIDEKFDGKCITVWSAPNYCYKCKNVAAIIHICSNQHTFLYFKEVENQRILNLPPNNYFN